MNTVWVRPAVGPIEDFVVEAQAEPFRQDPTMIVETHTQDRLTGGMPDAPWGRGAGSRRRCVRSGPAGTGPFRAPLGVRAFTGVLVAMGSAPD